MSKNIKAEMNNNLNGLRNSKNRNEVISVLMNENVPISVDDIFYKLKSKSENNKLSLSTVYRIIDKLIELNIVRKASTDEKKTLYELTQKGHRHYIICTKCKKMIALDTCPIKELEEKIYQNTGFHITGHKYELYGICQDCFNSEYKI